MALRETGAAPCSAAFREKTAKFDTSLSGSALSPAEQCFQKIELLRNQWQWPSCIGQGFTSCTDYLTRRSNPKAPLASAIDLWRDARWRQGKLERVVGTRPEYAIESLIKRGFSEYQNGEDLDDVVEPPTEIDDMGDELNAASHRLPEGFAHQLSYPGSSAVATVVTALQDGCAVVKCCGVGSAYANYYASRDADVVVFGPNDAGAYGPGHCERVFGYQKVGSSYQFAIAGSWGAGFGGIRCGDVWVPGAAWVNEKSLEACWDIVIISL